MQVCNIANTQLWGGNDHTTKLKSGVKQSECKQSSAQGNLMVDFYNKCSIWASISFVWSVVCRSFFDASFFDCNSSCDQDSRTEVLRRGLLTDLHWWPVEAALASHMIFVTHNLLHTVWVAWAKWLRCSCFDLPIFFLKQWCVQTAYICQVYLYVQTCVSGLQLHLCMDPQSVQLQCTGYLLKIQLIF